MMRSLVSRPCETTSPLTTLSSSTGRPKRISPSSPLIASTRSKDTVSPVSALSFSMRNTSPIEMRYCLPPLCMIAYWLMGA